MPPSAVHGRPAAVGVIGVMTVPSCGKLTLPVVVSMFDKVKKLAFRKQALIGTKRYMVDGEMQVREFERIKNEGRCLHLRS
jgi:hypothetical protein